MRSGAFAGIGLGGKTTAWNVYLRGKRFDTVFSSQDTADEVKRSLVDHDGYDPGIVVRKERKSKAKLGVLAGRGKSMREFIRENREEIRAAIKRVCSNCSVSNDEDLRQWILNDEGLYNWARSEGVRI